MIRIIKTSVYSSNKNRSNSIPRVDPISSSIKTTPIRPTSTITLTFCWAGLLYTRKKSLPSRVELLVCTRLNIHQVFSISIFDLPRTYSVKGHIHASLNCFVNYPINDNRCYLYALYHQIYRSTKHGTLINTNYQHD